MTQWNNDMSAAPRDGSVIVVRGREYDPPTGIFLYNVYALIVWDELENEGWLMENDYLTIFEDFIPDEWMLVDAATGAHD